MNERETITSFGQKPKNIGHVLRIWRAEQGLTQKDVADRLGISAQQFQKYDSGMSGIELSRMFEICRIFGKSPSEFLDSGSSPSNYSAAPANSGHDVMAAIQVDISFEISEVITEFLSIRKPEDKALALQMLRTISRR